MDTMRCFCTRIRTHHVKVVLLDEQELIQEIQDTSPGQEILDTVFRHLNLLETAYFGLRFLDSSNQTHWLDPSKKIAKQLKGTDPFTLYFGVKFYAADPCKLLEEITRYQFFLQVKQDILQGRLPVTFDLAAELGSYVVQSELGDYDPRRNSPGYVSEFRFLSNQTVELESRIGELHKGLIGQLPSVAEQSYLDKVKWLEMYGVDLHPVLGEDNVEYFLGLTPSGIIVLRNKSKVGNYYWPRISKIYFKGRYFMLRVCDKNNDENTYGFETPSKPACKHLWKCCVEHHAFFRLVQVSPTSPDIFALGSRFRYSGRTEKQAQKDVSLRVRSPPQFTRTPSRRYQRRIVEGAQDAPKVDEYENGENVPPHDKSASIHQSIHSSSVYRSTCSIPAAAPVLGRADSPRSTRSAPWTAQPQVRGLYTSASPRSVRSAGNNSQLLSRLTRRSSSVESQSSNDSRSHKRHRHRSRRGSDNESELSKSSNKSHSHRRHRRRSHGNRRDSGSEQDQHHRHRHKGSGRHRHGSHYELVESESQWKEVQRRQAEGGTGIHQATVTPSARRSGYMNSGMETESELSYLPKRNKKKHRSRSRSPSDGKARLPHELKRHLEYDLIDTEGMSEAQLREIPYKVVETAGKNARGKQLSPNAKRSHRSPRRAKSSTLEERNKPPSTGDSPPPPYSPPQKGGSAPSESMSLHKSTSSLANINGNAGESSPRTATPNGLSDFVNKNSGSSSGSHSPSGSMRARNANNNSINNNNNNSQLPRLPTSIGGMTTRSQHPSPAIRSYGSALYENPHSMLGKINGHTPTPHMLQSHWQNINNIKAQTISHEHSDSGLSAESHEYNPYIGGRPIVEGIPKYAQTTKTSAVTPQPSLPSLVSTPNANSGRSAYQNNSYRQNTPASSATVNNNAHNTSQNTPRSQQYQPSTRSQSSDSHQPVTHRKTPSLEVLNRHWEARKSGRNMGNGASGGLSFTGVEGVYSSPGAPQAGAYRPVANGAAASSPASNNNNSWTREWNGSVRSTRSGDDYRRAPIYYQQQTTVNSNSSILRDSNKFNASAMMSPGSWISDTDVIREDDEEGVEQTGNPQETVYRANGLGVGLGNGVSKGVVNGVVNGRPPIKPVHHVNTKKVNSNQEITHEMSTEL